MAAPDGSFAYCRRNINHERIVSIHDLQKLSKIELDLAMLWSEWNRRRFEGRTPARFSSAQWPISELQCQRCRSRSMADRRKDRGRATSGRIEITSSGGSSYVWRLRVTRMHFMVILIFVIVEVKRGSCFSFLIHKKEGGEVFQESRISQRNVPSFFWNIFFLKCTWDDVYNLLKIYYKFARCSTRPDELWKCPIIDEVMINVIRDSFASDVKKLRSKVDASVPFNKSGRASLNGDLPFSTTFAKSAKLRRLFYSPVGNMASHDNFGLWQHLRFLIPKRNWVKPSLFIEQALERVLQKQRKSGRKEEWAGENYYWNRYFSHPPDEHSPSSILATSIPDEQHLRTTPHYRAVSILSPWLANGSRRIPREMVDRASQIDFIHGRIHDWSP